LLSDPLKEEEYAVPENALLLAIKDDEYGVL
jgi:hypothetical protein